MAQSWKDEATPEIRTTAIIESANAVHMVTAYGFGEFLADAPVEILEIPTSWPDSLRFDWCDNRYP